MTNRLLLVGALLVTSVRVSGQEWTRFRGPNGTGISSATTIPVQFTESDYNWRVELPGKGHSSPVVWGKRIFLTSAEEEKGKRHVICLNAADGKTLWMRSYDYKPYAQHQLNTAASSTPAVDENQVYIAWATPDSVSILAFDHEGKELWKRDLGKLQIQHGCGTSPIVVDDLVIFSVDQDVDELECFTVALDRKTGLTRWKYTRPKPAGQAVAYSTPLVYRPKDGPPELIFSRSTFGFTSLDPKTGKLNWEASGAFTARCASSPVEANGLIFATAGTGGGEKQAAAVRPMSRKDGASPKIEYRFTRGAAYVPTPIVLGDRIFVWGDAGIVTCIKAGTGEQVWMERVGGNFLGSPVCINGKLYAMNTKGELVVIEASDQFKVLSRIDLGEQSHATPAVADGVLYLRTLSHLISVGGRKAAK